MPLDYSTLDSVKEQINLKASGISRDSALTLFLEIAGKRINKFLGVDSLKQATKTEYFDNTNGMIITKNYPIISVTSLTINDSVLSADDYRVFLDDGYIDLKGKTFETNSNIVLIYVYGYTTIPEDISYCTNLLVHRMFKLSGFGDNILDIDSKNFENYSQRYSNLPMPRDCLEILKTMKRIL